MSVTRDEVRRVAELARLTLPETALQGYVTQLNGILAHMEALQALPPLPPDAMPRAAGMPLRDDVPGAVPLARDAATFAPELRDGFFLVPRLATHEDAGEGA